MKILYAIAFLSLILGTIFDFVYNKRRKKIFDGRCNDYFCYSRALWIAGVTMLIIVSAITIFKL